LQETQAQLRAGAGSRSSSRRETPTQSKDSVRGEFGVSRWLKRAHTHALFTPSSIVPVLVTVHQRLSHPFLACPLFLIFPNSHAASSFLPIQPPAFLRKGSLFRLRVPAPFRTACIFACASWCNIKPSTLCNHFLHPSDLRSCSTATANQHQMNSTSTASGFVTAIFSSNGNINRNTRRRKRVARTKDPAALEDCIG